MLTTIHFETVVVNLQIIIYISQNQD